MGRPRDLGELVAWCRRHPWAVDVPVAAVTFVLSVSRRHPPSSEQMFASTGAGTLLVVAATCVVLLVRSRFPAPVWLLVLALAVGNCLVVGGPTPVLLPVLVAVYTLATRTPPRVAAAAAATTAVLLTAGVVAGSLPLLQPVTYAVVAWVGLAAALGGGVRSRRAVLAAAEDRAVTAEQTREEEAQRRVAEERLRIARDLHDVLAHHISVINVQAGVARHLLQSDPAAARESMEHVRVASQLVLTEMPTILGLLRTDEAHLEIAPAPGLAQVEHLVESVRRAGLEVSVHVSGSPVTLSPVTDLAAYRLLQEALTNARKHGRGSADLRVDYQDDRVVLSVRNPLVHPLPAGGDASGRGHGLIGMQERVSSVGGHLRMGPDDGSETFLVRAELGAEGAG